jgi:hypothetical protein
MTTYNEEIDGKNIRCNDEEIKCNNEDYDCCGNWIFDKEVHN